MSLWKPTSMWLFLSQIFSLLWLQSWTYKIWIYKCFHHTYLCYTNIDESKIIVHICLVNLFIFMSPFYESPQILLNWVYFHRHKSKFLHLERNENMLTNNISTLTYAKNILKICIRRGKLLFVLLFMFTIYIKIRKQ